MVIDHERIICNSCSILQKSFRNSYSYEYCTLFTDKTEEIKHRIISVILSFINAHEKLESGLANLLIGAVAEAGSARKTKTSKNAVLPEEMAGPSILVSQMDSDGSGATDFEEFTRWAEQHGLEERQVKLLWKDLNKNKDSVISNKEWTKFIQTRPNLQWLVTRLKSVVNRDV